MPTLDPKPGNDDDKDKQYYREELNKALPLSAQFALRQRLNSVDKLSHAEAKQLLKQCFIHMANKDLVVGKLLFDTLPKVPPLEDLEK